MKVEFQLLADCNLRCTYCCNDDYPGKEGELSSEVIKTIIASGRIDHATFTGGEPTMKWKELIELIKYCSKRGLTSQVNTNGLLLSVERIAELENAGLSTAYISFDGSNPDTFFALRGIKPRDARTLYDRLCANVEMLARSQVRVECDYKITKDNQGQLPATYQHLAKLGVDKISVRNVLISGRGTLELRVTEENFITELRETSKVVDRTTGPEMAVSSIDFREKNLLLEAPELPMYFTMSSCSAGKTSFYVRTSGEVFACNNVGDSGIGNMFIPDEREYVKNFFDIIDGKQDARISELKAEKGCSCAERSCSRLMPQHPTTQSVRYEV